MGYDLRLYASDPGGDAAGICIGHYSFESDDDLAAVKHARHAYAPSIANCDHVILLDSRGRTVWQAAAREVRDEARDAFDPPEPARKAG